MTKKRKSKSASTNSSPDSLQPSTDRQAEGTSKKKKSRTASNISSPDHTKPSTSRKKEVTSPDPITTGKEVNKKKTKGREYQPLISKFYSTGGDSSTDQDSDINSTPVIESKANKFRKDSPHSNKVSDNKLTVNKERSPLLQKELSLSEDDEQEEINAIRFAGMQSPANTEEDQPGTDTQTSPTEHLLNEPSIKILESMTIDMEEHNRLETGRITPSTNSPQYMELTPPLETTYPFMKGLSKKIQNVISTSPFIDSSVFNNLNEWDIKRFHIYVNDIHGDPLGAVRAFVTTREKNQRSKSLSYLDQIKQTTSASPAMDAPAIVPTINPIPSFLTPNNQNIDNRSQLFNEFTQFDTSTSSHESENNSTIFTSLKEVELAAIDIKDTITENPGRLNKGTTALVFEKIDHILTTLSNEKLNLYATEAKFNQLQKDMDINKKMLLLVQEKHQCQLEKTKIESQLLAQMQKEEDIKSIINDIYRKSSITADQMNQVLEKATSTIIDSCDKQETHFRRTIKWHKEEMNQAYQQNLAQIEEHYHNQLDDLHAKLRLQSDIHTKVIEDLQKSHTAAIKAIKEAHTANVKEITDLHKNARDLERQVLQENFKPEGTNIQKSKDEGTPSYMSIPTHPNFLDPNRRKYAPPPPDPLDEPESFIITTFPPQRTGYIREKIITNQTIRDSNIKINKIYNVKTGNVIIEVPTNTEGDKLFNIFHTVKEFKDLKLNIRKLQKRDPQIILFNIDPSYTSEDLKKSLLRQNECLDEESFTIDFNIPNKKNTNHWILSVHPDLFNYLDTADLYLDLHRLNYDEFLNIKQCTNCGLFGHTKKRCEQQHKTCLECGGEHGHRKPCRPRCINCKYSNNNFNQNFPTEHKCTDRVNCPNWGRQIALLKKTIRYQ